MNETKIKLFELIRMLPDLPECKEKKWIERLKEHPALVPGETLYVPTEALETCKELVSATRLQRQSESKVDIGS